MNENLQNAIQQLITTTLEGVDTSVDFLSAELPDYISQLLLWYGVYNFILFVVGLLLIPAIIINATQFYKYVESGDEKEAIAVPWFISSIVGSLVAMGFLLHSTNLTWLKIWIAPKVWLLEYAGNLIK